MVKCQVCETECLDDFCPNCNTHLIEIKGKWYPDLLYNSLVEFKNSQETYKNVEQNINEEVRKAAEPSFLSNKNHPNYYSEIENTVRELININNSMLKAKKICENMLYDETDLYTINRLNPIFGNVEVMVRDTLKIVENILDGVEYIVLRLLEVLVDDSFAQNIFRKYNVEHMFDDLNEVNSCNNSYSRKVDL